MRYLLTLLLFLSSIYLYSQNHNDVDTGREGYIGLDSGREKILIYENGIEGETALVIIGGIHGDERETVDVVNYLKDNLNLTIPGYFIPAINPTLYFSNRRGYLQKHLDEEGFVIKGSDLSQYNKSRYYRVFYGNSTTYKNNIETFIDPNRDFNRQQLPSTRAFLSFIENLKNEHKEIILISIHAYMKKGRIYPEYTLSGRDVKVNEKAMELTQLIQMGSGYISEKLYAPSIPIIERFTGEMIAYTGRDEVVTGIDIELDTLDKKYNRERCLKGLEYLVKELENILHK